MTTRVESAGNSFPHIIARHAIAHIDAYYRGTDAEMPVINFRGLPMTYDSPGLIELSLRELIDILSLYRVSLSPNINVHRVGLSGDRVENHRAPYKVIDGAIDYIKYVIKNGPA